MKIIRAYKTELKPNARERASLANHCGAARFAYNWGLARKIESYQLTGKSPTAIDLHKELNLLKISTYPWLYEVSKCAPQEALRDLYRAYFNFFRRCTLKARGVFKGNIGFPRFKSKKRCLGSFRLTGSISAEERKIKLPRLGWIRLQEKGYLPAESGTLHVLSATVTVSRFEPTSKRCSRCGWIKQDLSLSDRTFECESCGHTADRDENASDNIVLLAVSSTERINGRGGTVRPAHFRGLDPMKRQSEEMANLLSF